MGKGQGLQNQFYEPRRGRWLKRKDVRHGF